MVVKEVLLFVLYMSFLTPRIEQALGSFQHIAAWQITRKQPRKWGEGSWQYPPMVSALEKVVFEEIEVYIPKNHNTATQYIATRLILDLRDQSV